LIGKQAEPESPRSQVELFTKTNMNAKSFHTLILLATAVLLPAASGWGQSLTYSNAVASLNPAGYWPMHETTAAAPGDVETNYGTLGVLGNAYYPDYQVNSGAFIRQRSGPLANGADKAVQFTEPVNDAGGVTNSLAVPHTSPLATIKPPFTIEVWYMLTNLPSAGFQGDILSEGDGTKTQGFRMYCQDAGTNSSVVGFDILFYGPSGAGGAFQINWGGATTNTWHQLAVTCDVSSNVSTYLDGVLQTAAGADPRQIPSGRYQPDTHEPIVVGNGLGNGRAFNGLISEVSIYTNVISDIATHYSDGTNSNASASQYYNDVINDNPTIYLRMNSSPYSAPASATWPAIVNYGSANGTTAGDGVYTPGTVPGAVAGTAYTGYPLALSGTNVALLSGVSSFADVGYAAAYNPTGTTPFTVSAIFRGNPTDTNRVQSIAGHGTNSWELGLTVNGFVAFNSGTNSTAVVATGTGAGDLVSMTNTYDDGNWHWLVAVHNGTTNVLYVDGVMNNSNIVAANNVGNSLDAIIGSDPCYTNNPVGWGRQFAGQVAEVAFFTNALAASQIQSLYNAIGIPLYNLSQPVISRAGGSDVFTVTINGSAPTYQWYFNTVSNYSGATALANGGGVFGATTASVTIASLQAYYFVVVSNNYGAITSSIAQVASPLMAVSAGEPIWNLSSQTNVVVIFSDQLDPATATAAGNYLLNNGASVLSAQLAASNEVFLTTSVLNPGTAYTLTVQNVEDYYGLPVTPFPTNLVVGIYPARLALWVRANTGVTTDSDTTNSVNQWDDLSGNGNNLLGESILGFSEPLLETNAWGDLVLHFSGTNTSAGTALLANDAPSLEITGDMTVIAVANFTSSGFGAAQGEIVSKTGGNGSNGNIPAPYDYYGASGGASLYRGNGTAYGEFSGTNAISAGTPHILAVSETGNTVTHYVDGHFAGSGVLSGGFSETNCADQGQSVLVGGRSDVKNHHFLIGDLAELIVVSSAVSSSDLTALDNYLITEHNLQIVTINPNPTNIVTSIAGNHQITFSWPADHTGWQLQSNSIGLTATGAWYNVSGSTTTNQVTISPDATKTNVFFRLLYP
jgi:prepilin-type processing-associated H-X9-DG protein